MLLDACALMEAPSRGRCGDTIGEEAVNDAREEIPQVLRIALYGYDPVPVCRIRDEGVDALSA